MNVGSKCLVKECAGGEERRDEGDCRGRMGECSRPSQPLSPPTPPFSVPVAAAVAPARTAHAYPNKVPKCFSPGLFILE